MTTPTLSINPNDAINPSIAEKPITRTFTKDALDITKANWESWSSHMRDDLAMDALRCHIRAADDPLYIPPPDSATQPVAYRNWWVNDGAVRAYIRRNCAEAERDLLEGTAKTARAAWVLLEKLHLAELERQIHQANLLLSALSVRIPRDREQATKAREVQRDIKQAFRMPGGISEEVLISAVLSTALGSDHGHIREIVQSRMQSAAKDSPFTSQSIIEHLERDAERLGGEVRSDVHPVTRRNRKKRYKKCSKCKQGRHLALHCVQEGAGMEEKAVESTARRRAENRTNQGKRLTEGEVSAPQPKTSTEETPLVAPADIVGFAVLSSIDAESPMFNGGDFDSVVSTEELEGSFSDISNMSGSVEENGVLNYAEDTHSEGSIVYRSRSESRKAPRASI